MRIPRRKAGRGLAFGLALLMSLLVALSMLWGAAPGWAAAPITAPLQNIALEADPPACESCHPDEQVQWQASTHASATLNPAFQDQLHEQHNQAACLECHTTGFDMGSQTFLAEGVTCEACHGEYQEGHPAENTMTLPMASETCRACHRATFVQWEQSDHGQRNIECFDCHLSHSQGLRTGSEETLCVACHPPHETESAHVTHPIAGIACSGCHMSTQMSHEHPTAEVEVVASAHGFEVAPDACLECHVRNASAGAVPTAELVAAADRMDAELVERASAAGELEEQVRALEKRMDSLRNVAVMSMGLAFGMGGFIGLATGLVAVAMLRRPKSSEEQEDRP